MKPQGCPLVRPPAQQGLNPKWPWGMHLRLGHKGRVAAGSTLHAPPLGACLVAAVALAHVPAQRQGPVPHDPTFSLVSSALATQIQGG